MESMKLPSYKRISVLIFGGLTDRYIDAFKELTPRLRNANIRILLKAWISMAFLTTALSYFVTLIITLFLTNFLAIEFIYSIIIIVFVPVFASSFTFLFFYLYPIAKESSRKKSIENNLPFAVTHMAAIASSGIPPELMFELLTGFKEYGEISEESRLIMRNVKTFGMDSIDAIKSVAERTPSKTFREILLGITSTIETGGDLFTYLKEMSSKALFEYRIKREKYLKTLSTYADVYTALLVAAPLMMLSILATMSIIGGEVLGLTINDLVILITWVVLPIVNISFLAFIHITYPGV